MPQNRLVSKKFNQWMKMKTLITSQPWQALQQHYATIADKTMLDWFDQDPQRFANLSLSVGELFLDYSKNRLDKTTLKLLIDLAIAADLKTKMTVLRQGGIANPTEQRPALHTALRRPKNTPLVVDQHDVMPEIHAALDQIELFVRKVQHGQWLGATGLPITDIVNIGIGGSHLGPLMTTCALADFANPKLHCHFIANVDLDETKDVLAQINPKTTLFIISSKSFTTIETLTNASYVKNWLIEQLGAEHLGQHLVAVTASVAKAQAFGVPVENIFPIWAWVGGRYSIWSAVGLPLALLIGMDNFREFLAGAQAMDEHFFTADFTENMPVLLGLLGVWYINFFNSPHHVIAPYSQRLNYFRHYVQQADMESNGKGVNLAGDKVTYDTGPIILGEQGCNGQHAFHQLLHQGPRLIPVDFIVVKDSADDSPHHAVLLASCLSQAQALLQGQDGLAGVKSKDSYLAQHQAIPGNRPSNIICLEKLTPFNLGALIAMYEHKIFVQSVIWDINPFDQWGVELGKKLLPEILQSLQGHETTQTLDPSTAGLIKFFNKKVCE
jgi:glucose-6-phosphate isomerase